MTDAVFLVRGQLGYRLPKTGDEKNRVVAEAVAAPRCPDDAARTLAGERFRGEAGPRHSDDASEACREPVAGDALEFFQKQGDVLGIAGVLACEARGMDAGRIAEGAHLEAGVVGQGGQTTQAGVAFGLEDGVLFERAAGLGNLVCDTNIAE